MIDVSLLSIQLLVITGKRMFLDDELDLNNGASTENVVAEELTSHGYQLRYFYYKKNGEIDFIIEEKAKFIRLK